MECLGGCHCGNIHVRLRLTKPPEDNPLRACPCSFCRSHNPRMLSDPVGLFEVRADHWSLVERYRFGTRTCDFLICRRCGVFIAAIAEMPGGHSRSRKRESAWTIVDASRRFPRCTTFRARRSMTDYRDAQLTGCLRFCTSSRLLRGGPERRSTKSAETRRWSLAIPSTALCEALSPSGEPTGHRQSEFGSTEGAPNRLGRANRLA